MYLERSAAGRFAGITLGLILGAAVGPLVADEGPSRELLRAEKVKELLALGWDASPQSRREAEEIYDALLAGGSADANVGYAYALVLVKQRRYTEAAKLADLLVEARPESREFRRLRLWLAMLLKRWDQALAEIEVIGDQLAADRLRDRDADARVETARLLGRTFGYLGGPAAELVAPTVRTRTETALVERLSTTERTAYDAARKLVLDHFADLSNRQGLAAAKADLTAEQEAAIARAELDREAAELLARLDELKLRRQQVAEEADASRLQADREAAPLDRELATIQGQGVVLERELALVTSDLLRIQARLDRTRDPVLRRILLDDLRLAEIAAVRLDGQLEQLEIQRAQLALQKARIAAGLQSALAAAQSQIAAVAREEKQIDRRQRGMVIQKRELAKPAQGDTRRERAIQAEATAYTTYEPFPFESERRRVAAYFDEQAKAAAKDAEDKSREGDAGE